MYVILSWIIIIICWAFICFKLTDIIASISWWIKKKSRKHSKVLDLNIKILNSLSKELKVKIKCMYTSHSFFEFKYMNNKFLLYISEDRNYISITNKTNDKYKSIEYSSKHLYLDLVSFIKSSITESKKEIEIQKDYYGL